MLNPEQLGQITQEAISSSEEIKRKQEALIQESLAQEKRKEEIREELRLMRIEQRRDNTIQKITRLCELSAREGKNFADIMQLEFYETERNRGWREDNPTDPSRLNGAAKEVYEYLEGQGLRPSIHEFQCQDVRGEPDVLYFIRANW